MNENAMIEHIKEEPSVIREILENKEGYCREFINHFKAHDVKRVYLTGHGSPYNAGVVIRYMLEKLLKVEASVNYPSLFNNHCSFNANGLYKPEEMLLICPAQSGRTTGPVYSAKDAKRQGIPVICTTLLKEGILAENSDIVIVKKSGKEESFPETKGHIASIAILALCIIETAYELKRIDGAEYKRYMEAFRKLPESVDKAVAATEEWYSENKEMLLSAPYITFIGYGANYATAVEGGLKLLETTLKPCLSYELEEFMHGQNQPVGETSVIFFICPKEKERERAYELVSWCREKGCKNTVVIAQNGEADAYDKAILSDFTDCEFLSAIEYLIPFQVLSYALAKDMGLSSVVANHDDAGRELGVRFE